MKLEDLLPAGVDYRILGEPGLEISGLSYDSRRVKGGDLFFSLARVAEQNRRHMDEALSRGARAVVRRRRDEARRPAATLVDCENPRRLMAAVAARFFNAPSERLDLVGVTGTSGKTTTTYLLASIFEAAGCPTGIIGTIGVRIAGQERGGGLTTPESIDFEAVLREMELAGVSRVAAEISSIGIAEQRVEALSFRVCLFTNLGRDHLDYHLNEQNYFAAKLRLFTELLRRSRRGDPIAVARGDDPHGRRVLQAAPGRKVSFGLTSQCDVHPVSFKVGMDGIRAQLEVLGKAVELTSPLLGEINLLNILGAMAVSAALGIDGAVAAEGVRRCPGAPGRLETVSTGGGVTVLVDYAHKPDALKAVLETLSALGRGRILCVFGCGGDRDRGKRPIMGEIAARLADLPILTSDNPRSEDPIAIIGEVESGMTASGLSRLEASEAWSRQGYMVEPDRRSAIELALRLAKPGDMVLIAGKGHEDYQLVGARKLKFDDREVAREIVKELEHQQCA